MRSGVLTLLVVAVFAAGCDGQSEPVAQPSPTPTATTQPSYDESLPPAAAVMALVPEDATTLLVTDFDQVRLQLGQSQLTGKSPSAERDRFWRTALATEPLLIPGQLRPDRELLARSYGFTQDDMAWEARFTTPGGEGWVLRLRDGLALEPVARAISDGVPTLAGSSLDIDHRLITVGTTDDPAQSWAADPDRVALVGPLTTSTYVSAACVPFETVFGSDVESDLAPAPAGVLDGLDELGAFSVGFGGSLATARLGLPRPDAFDRARLADVLPRTDPEFGLGYADAVADPTTGRIGFRLEDPPTAARLAVLQHLPFAVCSA